ncbi:MAG: fructose-bisphosphatase class II family protein [Candidatus Promineifilaceae bacterium]|jgi:fructose-1,6-bisphosphatase II
MTANVPFRNIGLELVRVTENAAYAASRWIGSGDADGAHAAAHEAMYDTLSQAGINCYIAIAEEQRIPEQALICGSSIYGDPSTDVLDVDIAADPIDGTALLIKGRPGAISVLGIAPRGAMWTPLPAHYMDKIVVDRDSASALVPECLDAPPAWTLALVARAKGTQVRDMTVVVLARARHEELIEEIRSTGARILLLEEGDVAGALETVTVGNGVDLLMGVGGASQGVLTACAVKAFSGAMLARLSPQTKEEHEAISAAGMDTTKIYTQDDLVKSDQIFFSATGITDSAILSGVQTRTGYVELHSMLVRSETGTRRYIQSEKSLAFPM